MEDCDPASDTGKIRRISGIEKSLDCCKEACRGSKKFCHALFDAELILDDSGNIVRIRDLAVKYVNWLVMRNGKQEVFAFCALEGNLIK